MLSRLYGIEGVWIAYPIAFCTMCLLQIELLYAGLAQARHCPTDLTGGVPAQYYEHHRRQ